MSKKAKVINGIDIPEFQPAGRNVLIPFLNNIFHNDDEDGLLATERELTSKDFKTIVVNKGPGVAENIEIGDSIQIFPNKDNWYIPIEIEGTEYFLINDSLIVGVYK